MKKVASLELVDTRSIVLPVIRQHPKMFFRNRSGFYREKDVDRLLEEVNPFLAGRKIEYTMSRPKGCFTDEAVKRALSQEHLFSPTLAFAVIAAAMLEQQASKQNNDLLCEKGYNIFYLRVGVLYVLWTPWAKWGPRWEMEACYRDIDSMGVSERDRIFCPC